jgi:hypothetical protein
MGLQSFDWADSPGERPLADSPGGGVHQAVRPTSMGLSDASGRPADADVDVRTRDNPTFKAQKSIEY